MTYMLILSNKRLCQGKIFIKVLKNFTNKIYCVIMLIKEVNTYDKKEKEIIYNAGILFPYLEKFEHKDLFKNTAYVWEAVLKSRI